MNVLIFGATGMVGQGVLRECLLDTDVQSVRTVGRKVTGKQHARLSEMELVDLHNYNGVESQLTGFNACFFCLGVSSVGMSAEEYERVTYGITLAAAAVLYRLNPQMTFVYVSGAGTDSSEKGRSMWARVKGRTENALLRMPFRATFMFRPGAIIPLHGIQSKTASYRILYALVKPLLPVVKAVFPKHVLTTEEIGRAMLAVVRKGAPKPVLESPDIIAML